MSSAFTKATLPATLPERPVGWSKHLVAHMRLDEGVGMATYTIRDTEGRLMPFNWAYHSGGRDKAANYAGLILPGHEDKALKWSELRELWPTYYATLPD